jgi:hypothetical protein
MSTFFCYVSRVADLKLVIPMDELMILQCVAEVPWVRGWCASCFPLLKLGVLESCRWKEVASVNVS